jgi:hypothetical protein
MNKKISISHNGETYILEYDRDTVVRMENAGFSFADIESKPVSSVILLFKGAFLKNHKKLKEQEVMDIYEDLKKKEELHSALIEMYADVYEDTIGDENDESKKAEWKMV